MQSKEQDSIPGMLNSENFCSAWSSVTLDLKLQSVVFTRYALCCWNPCLSFWSLLLTFFPLYALFHSMSNLFLTPSSLPWQLIDACSHSSVFSDHSAAILALSRLPNLQEADLDSPISEAPPTLLPPFMEDWLSSFNLWTIEHKILALDAIVTM